MRMPVTQRNQPVGTHVLDCCQLFLRIKAEVLVGMVDVGQEVYLLDNLIRSATLAGNQTARLIGQLFLRMCQHFFKIRFL